MLRMARSMTAVNVYIAESSGVVSAAALGSEVQYFGLVMCYVKSYQQLICVVDSFFQNMERYWGNVLNCAFLFCRFLNQPTLIIYQENNLNLNLDHCLY